MDLGDSFGDKAKENVTQIFGNYCRCHATKINSPFERKIVHRFEIRIKFALSLKNL